LLLNPQAPIIHRVAPLEFALVDVFADAPLAGNPLAVVLGGERLDDAAMAGIARELNQSETTFLLPPRRADAAWRLRSFTAGGAEVVGAGHNALGAWWWLAASGREVPGVAGQELGDHVLPVEIARADGRFTVRMVQAPPQAGAAADPPARALGLPADALARAQVVSTGSPHLLVEARDRATVEAARPDAPRLAEALAAAGAQGCYLFALDPVEPGAAAHARFFNPTVGLWEDPATGSAAGPLAWWLVRRGDVPPGAVVVEQGHSMGRPSRLHLEVAGDRVTLSGSAVLTAEGRLHVNPDKEAGR